jgi:hypothetical protein
LALLSRSWWRQPCSGRAMESGAHCVFARRELDKRTNQCCGGPIWTKAVGFFDALIAQQDRHLGNMRWDSGSQRLGLFDHGYAFAVPGDYFNHSAFVEWRWNAGQQRLDAWEVAALQGLLNSYELHAVAPMLAPHRAQRLEERAQLMLASGAILARGQW